MEKIIFNFLKSLFNILNAVLSNVISEKILELFEKNQTNTDSDNGNDKKERKLKFFKNLIVLLPLIIACVLLDSISKLEWDDIIKYINILIYFLENI